MNGARSSELIMPRGLIFLASVWLIGSWLVAIGVPGPVQSSSASYEPGVRMLLLSVGFGVGIVWPMLRLSQQAPARPAAQVMLDLMVILALMQVVIWLPRLFTVWSVQRTAALDALLVSWAVLIGAFVASATGTDRSGPRMLAVSACLAACLLGPAAAWLWPGEIGPSRDTFGLGVGALGPLLGPWTLTSPATYTISAAQWQSIALLSAAAILAWIGLGLWYAARAKPRRESTA